jgi:hypothetical protein
MKWIVFRKTIMLKPTSSAAN